MKKIIVGTIAALSMTVANASLISEIDLINSGNTDEFFSFIDSETLVTSIIKYQWINGDPEFGHMAILSENDEGERIGITTLAFPNGTEKKTEIKYNIDGIHSAIITDDGVLTQDGESFKYSMMLKNDGIWWQSDSSQNQDNFDLFDFKWLTDTKLEVSIVANDYGIKSFRYTMSNVQRYEYDSVIEIIEPDAPVDIPEPSTLFLFSLVGIPLLMRRLT
ncbi:hypothetical protein CXF85_22500 [Colwellia sp. 75C3]|uniref:hypothetical protein n=1 Tax=Colwellia sp. 75C3 TaxID=888425 RepID=UPI000C31D37A|nr:hypothetical protein [Colwellia sp. 75C3]PKG80876.1 hypothetical protein CXF85_22500 [Colwellia sp. 75C3]